MFHPASMRLSAPFDGHQVGCWSASGTLAPGAYILGPACCGVMKGGWVYDKLQRWRSWRSLICFNGKTMRKSCKNIAKTWQIPCKWRFVAGEIVELLLGFPYVDPRPFWNGGIIFWINKGKSLNYSWGIIFLLEFGSDFKVQGWRTMFWTRERDTGNVLQDMVVAYATG